MKIKGKLMDAEGMKNTFRRLAHQIIEKNEGVENLVLIGIRTRGVTVAERIKACLDSIEGENVPMGVFDIALYRDDLEDLGSEVEFFGSEIDFSVDGKTVLICDDVLYTGRTVRAAIEAIFDLGRPASVRLLVLVDRGGRQMPVCADLVGKNIPTSSSEFIDVRFEEIEGEDSLGIRRAE